MTDPASPSRPARPRRRLLLTGGLGLVIALQLAVGLGVVAIRSQDSATTFTPDDAVAAFRAESDGAAGGTATTLAPVTTVAPAGGGVAITAPPAPGAATSTTTAPRASSGPAATTVRQPAAPSPSPTAAPAARPQVEPGVYTYATTGHEETDALGGARHDYPPETTITVVAKECGRSVTWRPLAERVDERLSCPGAAGVEVRRFASSHEFFGQKDQRVLTCPPGSLSVPDDATPGTRFSFRCTDPRTDSTTQGTVVGTEPFDVGGTQVQARRLRLVTSVTGDSQASSIVELWLRPSDGLLLRQVGQLDGKTSGPGGPIRYAERVDLRLRRLDPAR